MYIDELTDTWLCDLRDKDSEQRQEVLDDTLLKMGLLEDLAIGINRKVYLSLGLLCLPLMLHQWPKLKNPPSTLDLSKNPSSLSDMAPKSSQDNILYAHNFLTGQGIVDRSRGALKPMSPEAASGLIGNWVVETGSPDLTNLDVVEVNNNGAGRGISQWSHSRRGPYDQAREAAISNGVDPNSMDFQLGYFVDEYTGQHDNGGGSLIGWTQSMENHGQSDNLSAATSGFQNDYFRPSTAHGDRRQQAAVRVQNYINTAQPIVDTKPDSSPAPQPPAPDPQLTPEQIRVKRRGTAFR